MFRARLLLTNSQVDSFDAFHGCRGWPNGHLLEEVITPWLLTNNMRRRLTKQAFQAAERQRLRFVPAWQIGGGAGLPTVITDVAITVAPTLETIVKHKQHSQAD
jgi:hypothetical protein